MRKIEKKGVYKGFNYIITFMNTGWRCGYIGIPEGHKLYKRNLMGSNIVCHGGITFSDFDNELGYDLWWVGFDCNHLTDGLDLKSLKEYFDIDDSNSIISTYLDYKSNRPYITLEECYENCISIIDQLIKY